MIKDLKKLAYKLKRLGYKNESAMVTKIASDSEIETINYEGKNISFHRQDLMDGFQRLCDKFWEDDEEAYPEVVDFEKVEADGNYYWEVQCEGETPYSFAAWLVTNNYREYGSLTRQVTDIDGNYHYIYAEF
jgi:hypothetical protein